eukprot:gene41237-37523_t
MPPRPPSQPGRTRSDLERERAAEEDPALRMVSSPKRGSGQRGSGRLSGSLGRRRSVRLSVGDADGDGGGA